MTEAPQRSHVYPAARDAIDAPLLGQLWERTSGLLSAGRLASEKRIASADARGIVINGRFDLLLEGILDVLQPAGQGGKVEP
jgi:hypothetical protein